MMPEEVKLERQQGLMTLQLSKADFLALFV
jgi:hypothetical protein